MLGTESMVCRVTAGKENCSISVRVWLCTRQNRAGTSADLKESSLPLTDYV